MTQQTSGLKPSSANPDASSPGVIHMCRVTGGGRGEPSAAALGPSDVLTPTFPTQSWAQLIKRPSLEEGVSVLHKQLFSPPMTSPLATFHFLS